MKCECPYTLKVPEGNAFQVVFPVTTAKWEHDKKIVEVADPYALRNIVVKVDGNVWDLWTVEDRGPLLTFPAYSIAKGPHNVEITAEYFGVDIRAAYFECITMVKWSYESNIGNHIIDSPLVAEAAYIYIGITDDAELAALKAELRAEIAEMRAAKEHYEAMVEEYAEKIEELDDLATKTDVTTAQESIEGTVGTATATTTQNIATNEAHTAQNITTAKNEILAALPQEATEQEIDELFPSES